MIVTVLFGVLLLIAGLATVRNGGWAERSVVGVAACSAIASLFAAWPGDLRWHHVELALLFVDGAALAGFAIIMIKSERFWPIWTTSFQLCSVVSQLGPAFGHSKNAFAFAIDEQIWSWLILFQILWVSRSATWRRA